PGETSFRFIGRPVVRKEDERLTTGRGRFSDDFSVDGQAHAVMLRSEHPHARILGIDAGRAKAMPGVLGVFTGADCLADGLAAIPHDPLPKTKYDMKLEAAGGGPLFIGPHLLLPVDKVRHVARRWRWWWPKRCRKRSTRRNPSPSTMTSWRASTIPR